MSDWDEFNDKKDVADAKPTLEEITALEVVADAAWAAAEETAQHIGVTRDDLDQWPSPYADIR
jgi:hypothetical protein